METENAIINQTENVVIMETENVDLSDIIIHRTMDYDMFKRIKGNRPVNETHVKRLEKSFDEGYEFTVILVNEFMEIIDGQHRHEACKRKNLVINYRIEAGLRLEDAIIMNTSVSKWQKREFVKSYVELGKPAYVEFQNFRNKFEEFNLNVAEIIFTNSSDGANKTKRINGGINKAFQKGELEIDGDGLNLAYENAKKIMMFYPYHKNCVSRPFVLAMHRIFKHNKYDHNRMIKNVEKRPSKLVNCTNVSDYMEVLQKMYNYNHQNKVAW